MSTKLVKELYWPALKEAFPAGKVRINGQDVVFDQLQGAIEDGTLLSMVNDCADKLHSGDIKGVITAMRKNLASVKYHMNKKDKVDVAAETKRYNMLVDFLNSIDPVTTEAKPGKPVQTAGKHTWEFTKEDIDLIDPSDAKQLYSVYNCMHSKLTRYPEVIAEKFGLQNYLDTIDYVSNKYSEAKKAAKKVTVDESLLAKLASGKRTLTKAETEELLKVLNKLNK